MSARSSDSSQSLLVLAGFPSRIVSISLSDMSTRLVVPNCGFMPYALAIDEQRGRILWASKGSIKGSGFIEYVNADGKNRTTIIHQGTAFRLPSQMLIDTNSEYLYWADGDGARVMRSRFDGTEVTHLFQPAIDQGAIYARQRCVGIAIDQAGGYIYWIQKDRSAGSIGRITRARLDLPDDMDTRCRADVEILLSGLPDPLCLTWDGRGGFIYWTDRAQWPSENSLNRARLVNDRFIEVEILLTGLREGTLLALDGCHGRIFLCDPSGSIRMMNVDRPGESEVIFCGDFALSGIAYVPSAEAFGPRASR
jgi:hypothetical protein